MPDVEFGPVRERENPDRFTLVLAGVIGVPQFRTLAFGVPAVLGIAEGENPFLGAGFFLITARPAKGRIKTILVKGLFQAFGFHDLGVKG